MDDKTAATMGLTAEVVAAFVSNNTVAVADLPTLITTVHTALAGAGTPAREVDPQIVQPTAAQIRKSITTDALISFIDGKPYRALKRHLTRHGMTVASYKSKFGLPDDYPKTAPSYSQQRSDMAKAIGLGKGNAKPPAKTTKARAKSA